MKKLFSNNNESASQKRGSVDNKGEFSLAPGLCILYSPQMSELAHVRDIADVLLEMEKITPRQMEQVRKQQQQSKNGADVEQILGKFGLEADDILRAKAVLHGFEFRSIPVENVDRSAFEKLDPGYIRSSHVMPVSVENDTLIVATSEPTNIFAIDDVK